MTEAFNLARPERTSRQWLTYTEVLKTSRSLGKDHKSSIMGQVVSLPSRDAPPGVEEQKKVTFGVSVRQSLSWDLFLSPILTALYPRTQLEQQVKEIDARWTRPGPALRGPPSIPPPPTEPMPGPSSTDHSHPTPIVVMGRPQRLRRTAETTFPWPESALKRQSLPAAPGPTINMADRDPNAGESHSTGRQRRSQRNQPAHPWSICLPDIRRPGGTAREGRPDTAPNSPA